MTLDELAQAFEEKGFKRQAVLLRSKVGEGYVRALANPQWRSQIVQELGDNIYLQLQEHLYPMLTPLERGLRERSVVFFEPFKSRKFCQSPLEITVEFTLDFPSIQKAAEIAKQANELYCYATRTIYREVSENSDEDALYEMYKDADFINTTKKGKLPQLYKNMLQNRIRQIKRSLELNLYPIIMYERMCELSELIPPFSFSKFEDNNEVDEALSNLSQLIAEGEKILQKGGGFKKWKERLPLYERKRVLEIAYFEIDSGTVTEYEHYLFPDYSLIEGLLKFSLQDRKTFLYEHQNNINNFNSTVIGMQQLLAGGPITNPNASPTSILQNHNQFPNIRYSPETMSAIEEINGQLKQLLKDLPDLSDLTTPTKMRKKRNHTYIVEEIPKNPLDITFGNDSACCIFVPEEANKFQNGLFVPHYLLNPAVRLFGIYRTEEEKKQRMGLVLAFETRGKGGSKFLSCNSIELSQFGISGGRKTIQRIVEYTEGYLAGYAQAHLYDGCTMGSHSYNTSVNFSSQAGNRVQEIFQFINSGRFYSDIFVLDNKSEHMKTRPGSCYWLWKKEKS